MNTFLTHLSQNWKTTLSGFLTTFCAMAAAGAFAPNPFINTKVSGILLAIAGVGNIWLHITMVDAKPTTPPAPPTTTVTK